MTSVGDVFRFLILIGTGPGIVLLLRWFWWRINAWAEISAMVAGLVLAVAGYLDVFGVVPFGTLLRITAFGSLAVWLPVMYLTQPERPEVLAAFYRRVRPAGAWGPVRAATGLEAADRLGHDVGQWLLWVTVILGGTLALGWLLVR